MLLDRIPAECASSSSGAEVTERRKRRCNRATSSRQPAGGSPARGDARVPGSAAPGVGRDPGVEAGRSATDQSAASSEACGVVRNTATAAKREPSLHSAGEGHGRHLRAWSGCQGTLRRRGRGMVRRLSWELGRPSSAPGLRGSGSCPAYNRRREMAGGREGVGGGRSTA